MKAILLMANTLFLFIWNVNSQGHARTLQASTYSYLQAAQQMPDSTARFFLTSLDSKFASSGQVYMVDQVSEENFQISGILDTGDYKPLRDGVEITPIFLEGGNAILMVKSFQCDILFSDIIFVNQDGSVKWHLNFEAFFIPVIMDIGRVNKDVFALTDGNETFYFDFEGQEVFFPPSETSYYNIYFYDGHYYGNRGNRVYKLNADFDVVDSYQVDSISFFKHLGQHLFFIESKDGIEIVTNTFDVIASNQTISGVASVSFSDEYVWVITEEGLRVLDPDLQPSDFHPNEINEAMKYTWVYQDTTYVASEYTSPNHVDLVIRKYLPDQIIIGPITEAEISNLFFPDTIERKSWNNLSYAHQYYFESMGIEVMNNSEDTLRSCMINADWTSYLWCNYVEMEWMIDDIEIPPHSSAIVELGPFESGIMYYGYGPPFCFWVDNPNGRPDIFPSNDMLCGEALILSTWDENALTDALVIYPNPTAESLTISINSGMTVFHKVSIFNNLGQMVGEHHIPEPSLSIPVHDLNPGIYHVHLANEKSGIAHYSSFIKQ